MAIKHGYFPEGFPVVKIGEDTARASEQIHRRISEAAGKLSVMKNTIILPPGIARVTPAHWRKHTHEYIVETDPKGDGILHVMPRDDGVAYSEGAHLDVLQTGTKHIRIPHDTPLAPILGPNREGSHLMLWTLLVHEPGVAPIPPSVVTEVPQTFRG